MNRLAETTPVGSVARQALIIMLAGAFMISAAVLVAYHALAPTQGVTLQEDQVAPEDIYAPRSARYQSDVLTAEAQKLAALAVPPVYDPPDPSVLRTQTQLARAVLDYIDSVRRDTYATPEQQLADLEAISAVKLSPTMYPSLLSISDKDWKDVDVQVPQVLERAMRSGVRDDLLPEVYASLPNLVNATTGEDLADVIVQLGASLIRPNTFYNAERTEAARALARTNTPPVMQTFVQGQVIIRARQIVTAADIEALKWFDLLQTENRRFQVLLGAVMLVVLLSAVVMTYILRFHPAMTRDLNVVALIGSLILLFLAGARVFGTTDTFQSHLYPAAAFALIVMSVANAQVTSMLTAGLGALIAVVAGGSLEIAVTVALGGLAGVLTLRRVERLNAYFVAGLTIGLTNVATLLVFALIQDNVDPSRVVVIVAAGLLNGVLSAGVGLVGLYLVSHALNLPTTIRLMELSLPNHPLLQRLLREAPGTYQHSLQVANLAELAAERVGANTVLMRVAALYHDIGKIVAPQYFIENQVEGINPHDSVNDPKRSAQIIIAHVTDGEKMARKHHLPGVLVDFIMQHHGTMRVLFFYNRALEAVDCDETRVDVKAFTYPGPRPQTREAGILMLADLSESIVRSKRPRNKQEIEQIVREIFDKRMADGQLLDSGLTLNDLHVMREVFVSTLQGVFHPRIAYPTVTSTQEMTALQSLKPVLVDEETQT